MAKAVSHRPLTPEVWVSVRFRPCVFVMDKVALSQSFLQNLRLFPVSGIIPSVLHKSIYHLKVEQ
jgi:hypothetical protein